MAWFKCKCGNRIGFNTYPSRYDGSVMSDTASVAADEGAKEQLTAFKTAIQNGHRDEWISEFYGHVSINDRLAEHSDFEISDEETIEIILERHRSSHEQGIHQCERCGRLWLQHGSQGNIYESYLPEGKWRGALEMAGDGFVGYVAGQDFYGMVIEDVRQDDDMARVTLVGDEGKSTEVMFIGVTAVKLHDGAKNKSVRFLSEWTDVMPLRRFLFDCNFQDSEPLLEITAQELRL